MSEQKLITTYLSYSYPIDIAYVKSLGDMDINSSISSRLLNYDMDVSGQIASSIASSWKTIDDKTIELKLNPNAKWSDGTPITSMQAKQSLEHTKTRLDVSKGLFDQIEAIETPDESTLTFKLNILAKDSTVLMRLCEPTYSIVKIVNNKVDLSFSSGPFILVLQSNEELMLAKNKHWLEDSALLADTILIKQRNEMNAPAIITEGWANLVHSESLQTNEQVKNYQDKGLQVWNWQSHRSLFAIAGNRDLANTTKLLQHLNNTISKETITDGLSGFEYGNQLYPPGYILNKENFNCEISQGLPAIYSDKPVEVLLSPERIDKTLKDNFLKAIKEVTGLMPKVIEVSSKNGFATIQEGNFDLYLGTIAISNPNPDGSLDYIFRNKLVPSGLDENNFTNRLDETLKMNGEDTKLSEYKNILETAACSGHILPLLYFHTTSITPKNIDLSEVKDTDETVEFSKVRFK